MDVSVDSTVACSQWCCCEGKARGLGAVEAKAGWVDRRCSSRSTLTPLRRYDPAERRDTMKPTTPQTAPLGNARRQPSTRAHRDGVIVAEGFAVEDISELLAGHPDTIVWVDLCEPRRDELRVLAAELSLHELAVEDALGPHQRPKLDDYDTHQFLSIHVVRLDGVSGELAETEIDAFIYDRWMITIRKNDGFDIAEVTQRWDRHAKLAHHGVSFLLHGLLDVVVDHYFIAADGFDECYDAFSQSLFDDEPLHARDQQQWFRVRQSLVRFHRLVTSMREVVSAVIRRDDGALIGEMQHYYQDVYDHVLRINESSDALRDLGATIVETNLALRDYRQNQVTKKITSWAAIIAVPTLITGYYGMNVPFPGSGTGTGVGVSTALALGIPVGLFAYFRRKDWL